VTPSTLASPTLHGRVCEVLARLGRTLLVLGGAALVVGCTPSPPSVTVVREGTDTTLAVADPNAVGEAGGAGASTVEASIAEPVRSGPTDANATVAYVIDGDTVDVVLDGSPKEIRVRLLGIDTPETKKQDAPVECFGAEATAALRALLPEDTRIRLERDVEPLDRFGRTLAYVFRASDGLFVNHEMVRTGFALPLTYPPNVAHVDALTAAGDGARAQQAGLWTRCTSGHDPLSDPPTAGGSAAESTGLT
jgi:micrococcal nuclease